MFSSKWLGHWIRIYLSWISRRRLRRCWETIRMKCRAFGAIVGKISISGVLMRILGRSRDRQEWEVCRVSSSMEWVWVTRWCNWGDTMSRWGKSLLSKSKDRLSLGSKLWWKAQDGLWVVQINNRSAIELCIITDTRSTSQESRTEDYLSKPSHSQDKSSKQLIINTVREIRLHTRRLQDLQSNQSVYQFPVPSKNSNQSAQRMPKTKTLISPAVSVVISNPQTKTQHFWTP